MESLVDINNEIFNLKNRKKIILFKLNNNPSSEAEKFYNDLLLETNKKIERLEANREYTGYITSRDYRIALILDFLDAQHIPIGGLSQFSYSTSASQSSSESFPL